MLDTIRYWAALLAVVSIPPALLYWFIVHPFVAMWRRVGKVTTYLFLTVVFLGVMWWLITIRDTLLAVEYGADFRLWAPALVCYGLAMWIQIRIKKQLTFRVLAGVPELDPDGKGGELLHQGLYARMRHPRYVAIILGTIGWALFTNYLAMYLLVVVTTVGLALVAWLEERELVQRFGDAYMDYRRRVPMFIPRLGAGES